MFMPWLWVMHAWCKIWSRSIPNYHYVSGQNLILTKMLTYVRAIKSPISRIPHHLIHIGSPRRRPPLLESLQIAPKSTFIPKIFSSRQTPPPRANMDLPLILKTSPSGVTYSSRFLTSPKKSPVLTIDILASNYTTSFLPLWRRVMPLHSKWAVRQWKNSLHATPKSQRP